MPWSSSQLPPLLLLPTRLRPWQRRPLRRHQQPLLQRRPPPQHPLPPRWSLPPSGLSCSRLQLPQWLLSSVLRRLSPPQLPAGPCQLPPPPPPPPPLPTALPSSLA